MTFGSVRVSSLAAETSAISDLLSKDPRVESFYPISEQKALEIGRKQLPESAQYLKLGTFPASFSVKIYLTRSVTRSAT